MDTRGTHRRGRLLWMAAVHSPPTLSAVTALGMKSPGKRAHLWNIHLHLLVVDNLHHRPCAVGTGGQWNTDFLVDLLRPSAVCGRMAYPASWSFAAASPSSARKWRRLALARAQCLRQLFFEPLISLPKPQNLSICQAQRIQQTMQLPTQICVNLS